MTTTKKRKPLVPPDRVRCQAEIQEGGSFMQLGRHAFQRCESVPIVIVREVNPGRDGRRGSMSLCQSCLDAFKQRFPDWAKTFKVTEIKKR